MINDLFDDIKNKNIESSLYVDDSALWIKHENINFALE